VTAAHTADWCTCEPNHGDRCDWRLLADTICDLFNPPDDDVAEEAIVLAAVQRAADYIVSLPCTCVPGAGPPDYDEDPCGRCQALGRAQDKPLDR
jgi:hypothetical protein